MLHHSKWHLSPNSSFSVPSKCPCNLMELWSCHHLCNGNATNNFPFLKVLKHSHLQKDFADLHDTFPHGSKMIRNSFWLSITYLDVILNSSPIPLYSLKKSVRPHFKGLKYWDQTAENSWISNSDGKNSEIWICSYICDLSFTWCKRNIALHSCQSLTPAKIISLNVGSIYEGR